MSTDVAPPTPRPPPRRTFSGPLAAAAVSALLLLPVVGGVLLVRCSSGRDARARPSSRDGVAPVTPTPPALGRHDVAGSQDPLPGPSRRVLAGAITGPGGEGIARASVAVERARVVVGRAEADGEGRYRVDGVPAEPCVLRVEARGYRAASLRLEAATPGASVETHDVRLERAAEVAGRVVDPSGRPVAGAEVLACDEGGKPTRAEAGPDGAFRLPAEAAGCSSFARHDAFGASRPVVVETERELTHTLRAPGAIEGRVIDESGGALESFSLGVESFSAAPGDRSVFRRVGETRAFENGSFAWRDLPPGRYVLTASAPGRSTVSTAPIEVFSGVAAREVRIVVARGARVSGRVVDGTSGAPVAGASVMFDSATSTGALGGRSVRTDGDGAFTLEGAPAGPYTLRVDHEGYRTRLVTGLRGDARGEVRAIELTPREEGGRRTMEFAGIGAALRDADGNILLGEVFPGSPAEGAGLRAGDRVVRVDGEPTDGWSVALAVQRLRGPEGTSVRLSVLRASTGAALDVTVVRGKIVR